MKKLLILLLLVPSLSWGDEKVIYCYLYETSYKVDEGDGLINQMLDSRSFKNTEEIKYFVINDKKKIFMDIKKYKEYRPSIVKKNPNYSFTYNGNDTDNYDDSSVEKIHFNANEIVISYKYKKKEKDLIFLTELDRITGIYIETWGIYIDENGYKYSEDLDDNKFFQKDNGYEYLINLRHRKYICEPHKGL
ncbi:hypothetical protein N9O29_02215 [Alphaproteobacteria bacterium]|nr:hypothetical protein [Alphaproteobacteria bacterium]